MLGIRRIGAGRADYYLSDLAAELPVAGKGAGRWIGAAAVDLGLDSVVPVEPSQFRSLLAGLHPVTGRPLPLPLSPGGRRRVAGFDLTFSAPKSASVVYALGGEEVARTLVEAHMEAVAGALRYLEQHGLGSARRQREDGSRAVVGTSGFAGALFTHGVSRNLDPHLHSHVVVVNAVHGTDGRWSACDGRGLDAHRGAAGAVYEAHLRHGLTSALGVRWEMPSGPDRRTSEISGVPPTLLGEFSSRGADVRMHAFVMGAGSARGRRVAWAATRPPKTTGTPYDELVVAWRRRADFADAGLDLDLGRPVWLSAPRRGGAGARNAYDEHRYAGEIAVTPHGGAHRRDVVAAFAGSAPDGVAEATLERVTDLWVPRDGRVGVAESIATRRSVVPANHHLRALGPRPIDLAGHQTWLSAATALDTYRERWGIARSDEPLGADRALTSLPPARLADHLRVTRLLDAARLRLGRRAPVEMELGLDR